MEVSANMTDSCYTTPSAATCADFKRTNAGAGGLLEAHGRLPSAAAPVWAAATTLLLALFLGARS